MSKFIKVITVLYFTIFTPVKSQNPEWKEAHAWAQAKEKRHNNDVDFPRDCGCTHLIADNSNEEHKKEQHAIFLYKKLVNNIFDSKLLKFDDADKLYHRKFNLLITKEQSKSLSELTDLQDIDGIISDIMYQSKAKPADIIKDLYLSWYESFLQYLEKFTFSRQTLITIQFICVLLAWFASRKYKFSFWVVAVFSILYFVYNVLDSECHRKREIEEIADLMDRHVANPCDPNSYSFFSYYFGNPKSDCKAYMAKTYKNKTTCSIFDIYEELINIFVYKQLFNFVKNIADLIKNTYSTTGLITTALMVFMLHGYIMIFVKSLFKYILSPSVWRRPQIANNTNHTIPTPAIGDSGDRLSGENVNKILNLAHSQMKLAETIAKNMNEKNNLAISGVEILESNAGLIENNKFPIEANANTSNIIVEFKKSENSLEGDVENNKTKELLNVINIKQSYDDDDDDIVVLEHIKNE